MSTSILNGSVGTDQQNNSYIRPGSSCSDSTCVVSSNDGSRLHIDVARGGFFVYGTDYRGNRLQVNTNYINQGEVQFKSYGNICIIVLQNFFTIFGFSN